MMPEQEHLTLASLAAAADHAAAWSALSLESRTAVLHRVGAELTRQRPEMAHLLARDIGKPITLAHAEIQRSVALIDAVIGQAREPLASASTEGVLVRRLPLGVIAAITPWNNPIAIPIGTIAPALIFGNVVAWKPAPATVQLANRVRDSFRAAGLPEAALVVIHGDQSVARALMEHPQVSGVALSGSPAAGQAAHEICAHRRIPLQAELGGNNAAIVWPDADLDVAATKIAHGAFAFAGQRCTANRRVIVHASIHDDFLARLTHATRLLAWGDPFDPVTQIGPLLSAAAVDRIRELVGRARAAGHTAIVPHQTRPACAGAFYPPTIIVCRDADHEIVQEESFGPILVVQHAQDWNEAIQRCNGVRQGLAAALFSTDPSRHARFLAEAQAGTLKLNTATAEVGVNVPFGGWKASGLGAPRHGAANREFYTRFQTIYQ